MGFDLFDGWMLNFKKEKRERKKERKRKEGRTIKERGRENQN